MQVTATLNLSILICEKEDNDSIPPVGGWEGKASAWQTALTPQPGALTMISFSWFFSTLLTKVLEGDKMVSGGPGAGGKPMCSSWPCGAQSRGGLEEEELGPGLGLKGEQLRTTQSGEWWPRQGEGPNPQWRPTEPDLPSRHRGTSHVQASENHHLLSKEQCSGPGRGFVGLRVSQGTQGGVRPRPCPPVAKCKHGYNSSDVLPAGPLSLPSPR